MRWVWSRLPNVQHFSVSRDTMPDEPTMAKKDRRSNARGDT